MKRKSLFCNVVLVPPQKVAKSAVAVSVALKKRGGLFVLGGDNHPHITLYMTTFPVSNIVAVKRRLRKILKGIKPLRLEALKYEERNGGYVEIGFKKTGQISGIQKKIIDALNPLREGLVPKINIKSLNHGASKKKNIQLYGYSNAFSDFRPHLTLSLFRGAGRRGSKILPKSSLKNFSFTVKNIGIFLVGKYFTCGKTLGKFKLLK